MAPLVRHSCMLRRLRSFFSRERLAGVDPFGNEYYEILNSGRPRRFVIMKGAGSNAKSAAPMHYDGENVPVQWKSWLTHTRSEPPTLQELLQDETRKKLVTERARVLQSKWEQRKQELLKTEEYRLMFDKIKQEEHDQRVLDLEQLLNPPKVMEPADIPEEAIPSGQGESFQPGQWTAAVKQRKRTPSNQADPSSNKQ